jgi:hypothetical protein
MYIVAFVLWAAFLIVAAFYTRRAQNPGAQPLAAYLIFVIVFTVSAFTLFVILIVLLDALGSTGILTNPVAAAVFLIVVFIPAFLIARWQLRKPPRPPQRL